MYGEAEWSRKCSLESPEPLPSLGAIAYSPSPTYTPPRIACHGRDKDHNPAAPHSLSPRSSSFPFFESFPRHGHRPHLFPQHAPAPCSTISRKLPPSLAASCFHVCHPSLWMHRKAHLLPLSSFLEAIAFRRTSTPPTNAASSRTSLPSTQTVSPSSRTVKAKPVKLTTYYISYSKA